MLCKGLVMMPYKSRRVSCIRVWHSSLQPVPGPDGRCAGHRGCLSQSAREANARHASPGSANLLLVHTCVDLASCSSIWSGLVRP